MRNSIKLKLLKLSHRLFTAMTISKMLYKDRMLALPFIFLKRVIQRKSILKLCANSAMSLCQGTAPLLPYADCVASTGLAWQALICEDLALLPDTAVHALEFSCVCRLRWSHGKTNPCDHFNHCSIKQHRCSDPGLDGHLHPALISSPGWKTLWQKAATAVHLRRWQQDHLKAILVVCISL